MRAAISIDLDEVPCYCAIHGIPVPEDGRASAIYDRALPRLLDWLAREGVKATLFVVGRDLERPAVRARLAEAHRDGHEIASHSLSHYYDLTRRPVDTIRREVREATLAIERAVGVRPVGFRAPGYTITDTVFEVLAEDGYVYDSSVFPCPMYYAAKAAAIGLIKARGRTSRSIVDDPRVLSAPADPYRVSRPYYRARAPEGARGGLIELPIGVTRAITGRLWYIGTALALSSPRVAETLTHAIAGRPLVNLELHGIDLSDAVRDDLGFLAPHQIDLRKSADDKLRSLEAAVRTLRARGYEFSTLASAANAFARA
jgi:peptidoglycan/xylan/chitin deacetylase (PgdA/CDA1 family)